MFLWYVVLSSYFSSSLFLVVYFSRINVCFFFPSVLPCNFLLAVVKHFSRWLNYYRHYFHSRHSLLNFTWIFLFLRVLLLFLNDNFDSLLLLLLFALFCISCVFPFFHSCSLCNCPMGCWVGTQINKNWIELNWKKYNYYLQGSGVFGPKLFFLILFYNNSFFL
jgi:hypothetical protein